MYALEEGRVLELCPGTLALDVGEVEDGSAAVLEGGLYMACVQSLCSNGLLKGLEARHGLLLSDRTFLDDASLCSGTASCQERPDSLFHAACCGYFS